MLQIILLYKEIDTVKGMIIIQSTSSETSDTENWFQTCSNYLYFLSHMAQFLFLIIIFPPYSVLPIKASRLLSILQLSLPLSRLSFLLILLCPFFYCKRSSEQYIQTGSLLTSMAITLVQVTILSLCSAFDLYSPSVRVILLNSESDYCSAQNLEMLPNSGPDTHVAFPVCLN